MASTVPNSDTMFVSGAGALEVGVSLRNHHADLGRNLQSHAGTARRNFMRSLASPAATVHVLDDLDRYNSGAFRHSRNLALVLSDPP